MESKLLDKSTMQNVVGAKDVATALSLLFQTDYKKNISEFGGLEMKQELIDFALSKNLAENISKLVEITPTTQRKITRAVIGRYELLNVRLALEAKDRHLGYDAVATQIVDYGFYKATTIKEAMREEAVEGMLNRLMLNSPYANILQQALDTYRKTKSMLETLAVIDREYYKQLAAIILGLKGFDPSAALILKLGIDMRNVLTLIRAKKYGMKFADFADNVYERGTLTKRALEQMYNSSQSVEALVAQVKVFDLKEALEVYKGGGGKLIVFEIAIRNDIFRQSLNILRHAILSYSTIIAYMYLKEMEVFTLRITIKSRQYGLSKEEVARLITWRSE